MLSVARGPSRERLPNIPSVPDYPELRRWSNATSHREVAQKKQNSVGHSPEDHAGSKE
jgi:hypothetical protein